MKKLLCLAAASVLGFAAFAEGPLSLTVDTIAKWDSEDGLNVTAGDDDFVVQIEGSYEAEKGGAFLRLRAEDLKAQPFLHRYEAWIKPVELFKVSIGSTPVELYNEEVKWDVPYGAGIFEEGKHVYAEFYPVDGLTVGAGVQERGFSKDVQNGLAAWATYEISCVGSISAEYQAAKDAEVDYKVIAAQFNYNGIDNMNLLFGYAAVLDKFGKDSTDLAQHRASFDFRMSNDNMAFEVFDEAIIRNKDYGDFGDRFAAKFSYFLNDSVTPWLRAQYFMNYGPSWATNTVAWSEPQLKNNSGKDDWKVVVEPKVSIDFGKGVSAVLGAEINYASYNIAGDKKYRWAIPVEFIVAF